MSATMEAILKANTVQPPIETGHKFKANTVQRDCSALDVGVDFTEYQWLRW